MAVRAVNAPISGLFLELDSERECDDIDYGKRRMKMSLSENWNRVKWHLVLYTILKLMLYVHNL